MSEEVAGLLTALKWYADDRNWLVHCDGNLTGAHAWSHAGADGGEKAKQALAAWKQRKRQRR